MIFHDTTLPGVSEIHLEPVSDERGLFARSWCQKEFEAHGLNPRLVQCNLSFNFRKGTLRGIHYQEEPYQEAKLVRCTQGSIYDVAVDLRPQSPTFKRWHAVILSAENRQMIYIPEGCAHGFLTLTDNSEVFYQMSQVYHPESARGVRWNDPVFRINWPGEVKVISERDRTYSNFDSVQCTC
ncbi:MAG: dTDP-4-dehydrorhamnose 3,5-epimerase [Acidobacteriia bacterium]|nr:dTDP-4-dehydrorhamnose 3,5-epimerase [Terriglobia bacterium]